MNADSHMMRAPFPYFGGKRNAAPLVWDLLGDVGGYVEPFAGSIAVLLARPRFAGRRVETVNDMDGNIVNVWRAIKHAPDQVARECVGPVAELDMAARMLVLKYEAATLASRLAGDPEYYDAKLAAWWLYVASNAIGPAIDHGPWEREQDEAGVWRLVKHPKSKNGISRTIPNILKDSSGINGDTPLPDRLHAIAKRLERVRIVCGDWQRVTTPAMLQARRGPDTVGVFLDPPYANTYTGLYPHEHAKLSAHVREWCKTIDPSWRVVIAGYHHEHDELLDHGWTKHASRSGGAAGYNRSGPAAQQCERVWASPACIGQTSLFTELEGVTQ